MDAYKTDGTLYTDASGNYLTSFVSGETYTIYVQAVNEYYDGTTTTEYPGEAVTITYTAPAVETLTNLAYSNREGSYYYFTYDGTRSNNAYVYYQISQDATFATYDYYRSYTSNTNKLAIRTYYFTEGETYYIRAWFATTSLTSDEITALNPSTITFVAPAATLKTITNLSVYDIDSEYVYFRFDQVFDENDTDLYYIMEYNTTSASATDADWTSYYDTFSASESVSSTKLYASTFTAGTTYYLRAKVYSSSSSATPTVSNVVSFVVPAASTTISAISGLTLKEYNTTGYRFAVTGTLTENEQIQYWYSEDANFTTSYTTTKLTEVDNGSNGQAEFTIPYTDLTPGTTYYIKARVYNPNASTESDYGAFTGVATVTAKIPQVSVSTEDITSTSVTLRMNPDSTAYLTGYQVQIKVGKSYKTLAKTTEGTVKSSGLTKNKTYTYRVRPYYYNSETGKSTNGSWTYVQATTWGGSITLKATTTSKTKIKLSWNKVSGASGYEIYRAVASSDSTETTGIYSDGYTKYRLIKTIKKASTKTYTNKSLNSNLSYTYYVRAYKTVNGKKYYISSSPVTVDLNYQNFGTSNILNEVTNASGTVKLTWTRVYSASGYLIEKKNEDTGVWEEYTKLAKTKTSYTFPAVTDGDTDTYRIRAYKGTTYSSEYTVTVSPTIAAPTGVKATADSTTGAITVSWNAVSGAAYYRVYRTTAAATSYNTTKKTYSYKYYESVPVYTVNTAKVSGYEKSSTDNVYGTSIIDQEITYTYNNTTNTLYAGPEAGVKYYYFVVAYGSTGYNTTTATDGSSAKSAAASATITTTKVSKPTLKSATASSGKVTLKWKKVSGAAGYQIYRSTKKNSGYTLVGSVSKGSTVKYTDSTTTKGTTYYYKVRAYKLNEAGAYKYSSYSAKKKVTAK